MTYISMQLDSLLSYVPQLRRLSFHSLYRILEQTNRNMFNYIKPFDTCFFKLNFSMKFDQFEQMIINLFPNVQVLRIICRYSQNI